jgi:hypothetical protein
MKLIQELRKENLRLCLNKIQISMEEKNLKINVSYLFLNQLTMNFFYSTSNDNHSLLDLLEKRNVPLNNQNPNIHIAILSSEDLANNTEKCSLVQELNPVKIKSIENKIQNRMSCIQIHSILIPNHNKLNIIKGNYEAQALINNYTRDKVNIDVICHIHILNDVMIDTVPFYEKTNELINFINNDAAVVHDEYFSFRSKYTLNTNRAIIKDVLFEYQQMYPSFSKTSPNCRRPNFNITKFTELCNCIEFETKEDLHSKLKKINEEYKLRKNHSKLSPSTIKKCDDYNFYLFIFKTLSPDSL